MNEKIIFRRKIYNTMLMWKDKYAPKYALFLKGARRVGKTTIAEEFGKNEYKSYLEIRFDYAEEYIKDLFVNGLMDLDKFFSLLEINYHTKLYKRESLIILDEIQLFPKARQALKRLLEDGRFDYIETGSLASVIKRSKSEEILIPSEEYQVEMFPLSFEEYLSALDDDQTIKDIKEHYKNLNPFGQHMHKNILTKFREYMCVGGMPEAVSSFIKTKDFEGADFAKQEILSLYINDIKEQKKENPTYVGNILYNIPSELSHHDSGNNIFCLSHIDSNARLREYSSSLNWLSDAMIVNTARNTLDPSSALTLNLSGERFKCYLLDTGLLINLAFNDGTFLDNEFYKAILLDNLHINEGMFLENVVSQCLRCNGHNLFFYVDYNNKNKESMEIDFLIRKNNKVIPIEVKSGVSISLTSLNMFRKKFSPKIREMYVLYDGDIKKDGDVIYLPYYCASVL